MKAERANAVKALEMRTSIHGHTSSHGEKDLPRIECQFNGKIATWERANLKPNTGYACVMVELPEGHRLVTEEERKLYSRNDVAVMNYINNGMEWSRHACSSKTWMNNTIYAVPTNHVWAESVKRYDIAITLNGKTVDPATISNESWETLRNA